MRSLLCRAAALALAALTIAPAAAAAKDYSAERFDSRVRLMPGGTLEVTETVVFRFESGTFDHVFREIPARRTDGIEIVRAGLDGRLFPIGNAVNQIEVTGRSKVRVRWRFHPLADSTHVFTLTYLARGVVSQTAGADVLAWRALPTEHQYRIDSSTVDFEWPSTIAGGTRPTPKMEWHRIDGPVAAGTGTSAEAVPGPAVRATAQQVRPNGWIEATFAFPRGSILSAPPAWQQARLHAQSFAPRWMTAAALIALAGLIVLMGLRQQYDAPPRDQSTMAGSPATPDALAPGLVGPLLSNGRAGLDHAFAALFSLAERGVLSVQERPRGRFGQPGFDLRRRNTRVPLAEHENALLTIGFQDPNAEDAVPLSRVRRQLGRRFRQFRSAVHHDLMREGLIDPDRKRIRDRYVRVSIAFFILAGLGMAAAVPFVNRFGGWPMLVPAAFALLGMAGLIFSAATTALSNEGARRAARWRGFRAYLKSLSQSREQTAVAGLDRLLPFAIATGLGAAWARYLKRHPGSVPPWFRALSIASQDGAFASFVTSSGAGGSGASGAGAAGGGSSGAG
jgi:hypothetical protein